VVVVNVSEKTLAQAIEAALLAGGPDAYADGEGLIIELLPTAATGGPKMTVNTRVGSGFLVL
jgi:hypothetical protein